MNLLILTQHPFPQGAAQTNRLLAIAKGLQESGASVKVFAIKPTEKYNKVYNNKIEGSFDNIIFEYPGKTTIRYRSILNRLFHLFKSYLFSLYRICLENKKRKIDVIYMGYSSSIITFFVFLLSRCLNISFIQERSEFAFLSFPKSIIGRINKIIYLTIVCKLFDGFIVITDILGEYYRKHLRSSTKLYVLPILVDPEPFLNNNSPKNYITYCGSMNGNKDGISILIDAFKEIAERYPTLYLKLVGNNEFVEFESLKKRIENLDLHNRIEFTGFLERSKLISILKNSMLLVLARPMIIQNKGNFPTKLGEYLATGKPVVISNVGEIGKFLIHEKNAFISEPDSAEAFARQLENALSDYEKASKIGLEGKKLAFNEFNYKVQGKKLLEWLKTLKDD